MVTADLLRLGSVKTIQLRLDSYTGLLSGFSFRAITCKYGATPPPSVSEISILPREIEVVLFPGCPVQAELPRLSLGWHVFRYVRPWTNFIVELHGSFDDYWNRYSSKTRWSIKRKAEKLAEAYGQIQYRKYRSPEEMTEFHYAAEQVRLGKYGEKVLQNAIPKEPSFYRKTLELASRDEARAYLMLLKSKPIAYLYCVARDDAIVHEISGYDPELARFSPGVLLQRYALQQLFAEQSFSTFDFSSGCGQHKIFFSTTCTKRADVYFFQKTPRAVAFVSFDLGVGLGVEKSRAMVRTLHLESRVRRVARWAMTHWAA